MTPEKNIKHICEICEEVFQDEKSLLTHQQSLHGIYLTKEYDSDEDFNDFLAKIDISTTPCSNVMSNEVSTMHPHTQNNAIQTFDQKSLKDSVSPTKITEQHSFQHNPCNIHKKCSDEIRMKIPDKSVDSKTGGENQFLRLIQPKSNVQFLKLNACFFGPYLIIQNNDVTEKTPNLSHVVNKEQRRLDSKTHFNNSTNQHDVSLKNDEESSQSVDEESSQSVDEESSQSVDEEIENMSKTRKPDTCNAVKNQKTSRLRRDMLLTTTVRDVKKRCRIKPLKQENPKDFPFSFEPETGKISCIVCNLNFSDKNVLTVHYSTHVKCNYCHKRFINRTEKRNHRIQEHGRTMKIWDCNICGEKRDHKTAMMNHMKIHYGEDKECCPICGKYFLDLNSHMDTHKEKKFICKICESRFCSSRILKRHIRIKHKSSESRYKCSYPSCKKGFSLLSQLNNHVLTHDKSVKFKCDVCDQEFKSKKKRQQHFYEHHSGHGKVVCDLCGKEMTRKSFSRHMVTNHSNGPPQYTCEFCGRGFTTKVLLSMHRLTHTGEKNFKCKFCQKLFSRGDNLRSHIRSHTGEKPYKCDVCDKSFTRKDNLNTHRKQHGSAPI